MDVFVYYLHLGHSSAFEAIPVHQGLASVVMEHLQSAQTLLLSDRNKLSGTLQECTQPIPPLMNAKCTGSRAKPLPERPWT